ncbi:uncharacterized protein LOC129917919 [Episyrphus balteatus]|uniref:uncharacterized protein LOC129917919 n=1 Tax=Episyrphus balteatus TaxID=286459 RepID=UPI00248682C8|nr:uncharacterized protein LOC129917919 [Episyrphus balteatus]
MPPTVMEDFYRVLMVMPKRTYRIDENRKCFAVKPNNHKRSLVKRAMSKSSSIPITSRIRPTLPSIPELNNRWKSTCAMANIQSSVPTEGVKLFKGKSGIRTVPFC